jgi:hypothetical protein
MDANGNKKPAKAFILGLCGSLLVLFGPVFGGAGGT